MEKKKRIVVAEDHQILRDGLKAILNASDDLVVVGEAEDGLEAIRRIQQLAPDLALLDLLGTDKVYLEIFSKAAL